MNAHYVTDAKRLKEASPQVVKLAVDGHLNMQQAKQLARLPERAQKKAAEAINHKGQPAKKVLGKLKADEKRRTARSIGRTPTGLPHKKTFRVIAVDPPWRYDTTVEKHSGLRSLVTYPDMSVAEICALPVKKLAADDCVLWLWTTNAFMESAFECLNAWGFGAKTILTWDKQKMGAGHWLRNVTEHCVLAVRGNPKVALKNETTLISEKRREHSRKPEAFYKLVERVCPGSKLEMFARQKRDGWAAWGAEKEKFDAVRA